MTDVGHNGMTPELSEEQSRSLTLNHSATVRRLREQMAAINSKLRHAFKEAKSNGVSKREIDYMLSLRKDAEEGSGEALAWRRKQAQIARWISHPIGDQPDMFAETDPKTVDAATKEFEAGKVAGMEGETLRVPDWVQDPAQFTAGWHRGQEVLQSTLPLTRSGVAGNGVAPAKRGRKAKSEIDSIVNDTKPFREQVKKARAKGDATEKGA